MFDTAISLVLADAQAYMYVWLALDSCALGLSSLCLGVVKVDS